MKTIFEKIIVITLLTFSPILSQKYNFHYYNKSDGLINTNITSISQDEAGFIWIGSKNGLNKYDGYKFLEVNGPSNSLSTEITDITCNSEGIWIGTATRGLFLISKKQTVNYLNEKIKFLPNEIKRLKKINNKEILIITGKDDIYIARNDSQIVPILNDVKLPQTKFNDITTIENGFALATDDGLLFIQYNRIRYKFDSYSKTKLRPKVIAKDHNNNIYFANENGSIYKIENYELKEVQFVSENKQLEHLSLLYSKDNALYLGSDEGIIRIEGDKKTFINFDNGLPHQVVTFLFEDRENNLWIGTLNGLAKLNSIAIINFPSLIPPKNNFIQKIHSDHNDVFIFTNDGIAIFNKKDLSYKSVRYNFSGENKINDVIELSNNIKLLATLNGLKELRGEKILDSKLNKLLPTSKILSLAKDYDDKLYIGTDSGLCVFQNDKLIDYLSIDDVLPGNQINALLVTLSNDLFIGTDAGLVKISNDSKLVLRTTNGLSDNYITSLYEDPNGKIWIGTKNGISSFKNGRFSNYIPKLGGTIVKEINDVVAFDKNKIWAATSKGIYGIENEINFSTLTAQDGILSDNITTLLYDHDSNILFIGTDSGLSIVQLKYFKKKNFIYQIYFLSFQTEKRTYPLENINVSKNEDSIKIYISLFSFHDEKKIVYRYRIKELDDNWNYLTKSNVITFNKLPSGSYTLIVDASLDGIHWLKQEAQLKFRIQASFLRKLNFYILLGTGVTLIILILIIIRPRKKSNKIIEEDVKIEEEKSEKIESSFQEKEIEVDDLIKKLEQKIIVFKDIISEKDWEIEQLKLQLKDLEERINTLEKQLSTEDEEFVDKSRIDIIIKDSHQADEIKKYIDALEKTNWNIRQAAKLLNLPHSTFHYRLKKLNLLKNK